MKVDDNIGERTVDEKKRLARSSNYIVVTSAYANMVGTLIIAKVKVAIASIMKDDRVACIKVLRSTRCQNFV